MTVELGQNILVPDRSRDFNIGIDSSPHPTPYGAEIAGNHVDALPVGYDQVRWPAFFLANRSAGSPTHLSYFSRITEGPDYLIERARFPAHSPEYCV